MGLISSERDGHAQSCALQSPLNATENLSNIWVIKTRNQKVDNSTAAFPEPFDRTTRGVSTLFDDLFDAHPGSRGDIRSPVEHARNGRNRDTGFGGDLSNCTTFG